MKLNLPPKPVRMVAALGIASLTLLAAGVPQATAKRAPEVTSKMVAEGPSTRSIDLKTDAPGDDFGAIWAQFERQVASKRSDDAAPLYGDSHTFVRFSAMTGAPRLVYGDLGMAPSAGKAGDRARLFLEQNAHVFGIDMSAMRTEREVGGKTTPLHAFYEQRYKGLPVFYAGAAVHMTVEGRVWGVNNTYAPVTEKSTTPALAANAAVDAALAELRVERAALVADHTPAPELGIWPTADGGRLAWKSVVTIRDNGTWEVIVDAQSGEILEPPVSLTCNADGQGTVFRPNAVVTTGNDGLRDNANPFPENAYTAVTLPNLNPAPNSNIVGAFAQVHPSHASKASAADLNFSSLRRSTTGTPQFNQANVYWGLDFAHGVFVGLGFSPANGNAVMNYPIYFYAHNSPDVGGGGTVDNSHFSGDNSQGSGTGHLCFGTGGVDDGEDQEVIWHEYGHSVLWNQRPGINQNVSREGMGEGFGDYLASTMSKRMPGDPSYYVTVMEWDATSYNANGSPHPFLRKLDNPTFWENRPNQVHDAGEIWSHPLFDFDGQVGPDVALTVILEGNFLLDLSPTQQEGANAMVTAAQMRFGGATVPFVQNAFRERHTLAGTVVPVVHTIGFGQPGTGNFFLRNSNVPGGADVVVNFGSGTFTQIAGDWNGDGRDTIGAYDPATGAFFLKNTNVPGGADIVFTFGGGGATLVPLVGDWDGNGTETVGLYDTATGAFFLKNSNANGGADIVFTFGGGGATVFPVAGDWNGDGVDTVGIYNTASGTFFLKNTNASGGADLGFGFGGAVATYRPVVGDWNADNTHTVGLYDTATGGFFIRNTNDSGDANYIVTFGAAGNRPLAGDWNGGMH